MRKLNNHTGRIWCLILVLGGIMIGAALMLGAAVVASAQVIGPSWAPTGDLSRWSYFGKATLLPNGKVLVVYGRTAQLYDPTTEVWSITGSLNIPRSNCTITLLPNGKVLVAGGWNHSSLPALPTDTAELYDPTTGIWSTTGNLITPRLHHAATLLPDGRVLVAGGSTGSPGDSRGPPVRYTPLNSAELYDPATGMWSVTGNLNTTYQGSTAYQRSTAALLPSGEVLVAGHNCCPHVTSAELYNPVTGTWSITGNPANATDVATLLPNGKVLVLVGFPERLGAELYDPATGVWSYTTSLHSDRFGATATLLPNGKVLVAGGSYTDLGAAELYDPATGIWDRTANLITGRYGHTATLLPNGKVLVAGGTDDLDEDMDDQVSLLKSAELFDLNLSQSGTITSVSAASFSMMGLASEAIAASFGANLATKTISATTLPLPTELAGTTVIVTDSAGAARLAPLFFVSPTQVNYQIPPGTTPGAASVTITSGDGAVSAGMTIVNAVAPSLFTANQSGQGVAAAVALRVKADGSRSYEEIAEFDAAQNKLVARPLDLGSEGDQVFLILYGTGIRFHNSLSTVIATIGGTYADVSFAGEQPDFVGLDQVNVLLPRSLIGSGEVDVLLTVEAQMANPVRINIK